MKTNTLLKLLCVSLLLVGLGCKKKSKELTTVNFHLYNPASGQGYSGVKVSILQEKNTSEGFNSSSETEVVWEGVTDADGKASYSFKAYNNTKYSYWETVDKSFLQNPSIKILQKAEFVPLDKNEINVIEYTATVPASYLLHIKNVNCFNQFDRFRYRVDWLYNSGLFDWSNWSNDQFDCYEAINLTNGFNDYLIYQYEVERNGVLNTYMDTFYITPNFIDTLKIYY